ncbi:maltase-glucoamylase-like [Dermacentor silvarum]|uniref:maltase-glucoamylase-like n=1 Tax=Dermacentor silvarum TaxID=543639 RepID=UPI002101CF02|nr:maltase-glucoamylase-like [Dermacentor silvarum]
MGFDRLGTSFGVYFRTSAIFEVLGHMTPALTFRSLGNQVDVFVFGGPSPADVVRQYLDVVGKPAMPPFWAMGLHASLPRMPTRPAQGALDDSDDEDPLRALLTYSNYHVDVAWLPVDVAKDTCEHSWQRETMNRLALAATGAHSGSNPERATFSNVRVPVSVDRGPVLGSPSRQP